MVLGLRVVGFRILRLGCGYQGLACRGLGFGVSGVVLRDLRV